MATQRLNVVGSDGVTIRGMREFLRMLAALGDEGELYRQALKDTHQAVAEKVKGDAAASMSGDRGGMGRSAAATLKLARMLRSAGIYFGGVPWAMGVEFGAYRNMLRLRKNTGGRAYIVREGMSAKATGLWIEESIAEHRKRIEAQWVDGSRGSTRKGWGEQVRIVGQVRGWNQFRQWTGNDEQAGYHLFPAVRANREWIAEQYEKSIAEIINRYTSARAA